MLAQKRRKEKYSSNPNGNLWSNDPNTFGRKMLERMGWSSGQGLGKKKDGISSPIKCSSQVDKRGLGMKRSQHFGIPRQIEDYADLLKSLNTFTFPYRTVSSNRSSNLEEISKSTPKRIHYGKFMKAKNVYNYDPKSLAIILGISPASSINIESQAKIESDHASEHVAASFLDFGVKTTTSATTSAAYFAQKAVNTKKLHPVLCSTDVLSTVEIEGNDNVTIDNSVYSTTNCGPSCAASDESMAFDSYGSSGKQDSHISLSHSSNEITEVGCEQPSLSKKYKDSCESSTTTSHCQLSLDVEPSDPVVESDNPDEKALSLVQDPTCVFTLAVFNQTNLLDLPGYLPY